jgi:hypothetical protein
MTATPETAAAYHPWTTYIYAREEARRRGDRKVGTEHVVLGLMRDPALAELFDVDLETARQALAAIDGDALATLGIDPGIAAPPVPSHELSDRPPRPTLKRVLQDRLPLTPAGKNALRAGEKDLRRRRAVDPRQVLAALLVLEPPDPAAQLFARLGIDREALRARLS